MTNENQGATVDRIIERNTTTAHEVTTDEREALARAWDAGHRKGIRWKRGDAPENPYRSQVPEPSAEGPAFIAIMPPSPETSKRWYSMYCRVCGVEEMMADTADDPRLLDRRDEHNRERHAEPQGEPSDAQVDAVAKAIAEAANADYWTDEIAEWEGSEAWEREAHPDNNPHTAYEDREEFRKQARAALRAAGVS